ncbi:hypothetical protein NE237_018902 [Protea cynaroides]|uniref:Uncharacterized protein n=1 Tax=Protea cynaroides TaxID=273540 RepID=A0A9Q0KAQ8_9MAGN|nr:hypothetical protein NE237_018902 [Protea cynaroides]
MAPARRAESAYNLEGTSVRMAREEVRQERMDISIGQNGPVPDIHPKKGVEDMILPPNIGEVPQRSRGPQWSPPWARSRSHQSVDSCRHKTPERSILVESFGPVPRYEPTEVIVSNRVSPTKSRGSSVHDRLGSRNDNRARRRGDTAYEVELEA